MSAESLGLIQSPEHKRMRSGQKPLTESICRRLDHDLEDAIESGQDAVSSSSISTTIVNTASFDSLDQVLQDMDVIQQMDSRISIANSSQSNNPDPESQYTASQTTHEENDTTATPSPGQGISP
jgi:hypothetical protein